MMEENGNHNYGKGKNNLHILQRKKFPYSSFPDFILQCMPILKKALICQINTW